MIGAQIGPYVVSAKLGEGGMGEVYRARDTTLGRDVAIKVLPAALTASPEQLERFEREARLLAALNHPNIAHIYGLERREGIGERERQDGREGQGRDSTYAIVMELVEGPTLLDRIAEGPIALREALAIAKQLASALEAAHDAGIVHRDLKPANIKVRKDGTVKVLDFGLAKATGGDAAAMAATDSATRAPATRVGIVVGTPAYMSPEQARGQMVDKRTDIWAFGCVLYEMITGRIAFGRETVSDTIVAILEREPDWQLPDSARPLRRLLERCLDKDARTRLRDIGDAMSLVDEQPPAVQAVTRSRTKERVLAAVAAAAVVSLAAVAIWSLRRPAPPPGELVRFTLQAPPGQQIAPGDAASGALALSPDGRQIAFVAGPTADQSMVWIRSLDTVAARPLPGTEGAAQIFWSPDGKYIGFAHAGLGGRRRLLKIPVAGGPPYELGDTAPAKAAWSPQGVIVFPHPDLRLHRISENGGPSTPVTTLDESRQEISHGWPAFLPDGRRFLFFARSQTPANNALFLASIDSPERTHVVDALSSVEYASGHLLYQRDGTLVAQPFDENEGRVTGDAVPLVERVMYNANSGRVAMGASQTGTIVYRTGPSNLSRLTWVDAGGRATATVGADGFYFDTSLSPDGRWIAVTRSDQISANGDIWLIDVERGVPTRLTSDRADDNMPVWSPDSKFIVFASNRKGHFDLYRRPSSGAAAEALIFESADAKRPTSISPDGKLLLFDRQLGPDRRRDIWAVPLNGDGKAFEVVSSEHAEGYGAFSPDGKWIVHDTDNEGGQVVVESFPPSGPPVRVSTLAGFSPKWLADGKRIVYVTFDRRFMEVEVTTSGGQIRAKPARELFQHSARRQIPRLVRDYAVDGSGSRFLMAAPAEEGEREASLQVVLNWVTGLRAPR